MSVATMSEHGSVIVDGLFDYADHYNFGDLHFKYDRATGMRAIIAIHSTKLGPALGGCRFIEYDSTGDALTDAMRLARGMSYKAAITGLPLGGGKAVIIKPKNLKDRTALFAAFGRFIEELAGRYITAVDSGSEIDDMDVIMQQTRYCASGSNLNGDPSPSTAWGVFKALQASVQHKFGKDDLSGLHVAIQGAGHVGYILAKNLHEHGAKISVSDINPAAVQRCVDEFQATAVDCKDIHRIDCDVYAPCALGAIINDATIPELKASIVCGGANNQLAHARHGTQLFEKGILYAPDYLINAGGLIYAFSHYAKKSREELEPMIDNIYNTVMEIYQRADKEQRSTSEVADAIAAEKLA